jgi:radical SAM superfamily enzyme YgiQ (UPF0313 family)
LLIIAAALRDAGFGIDYVIWSDENDRSRIPELAKRASAIALTCMTSGHDIAKLVASTVRAINPCALIILGGPHSTALGQRLLDEIPALDAVTKGDGHNLIVELLASAPQIDGIPGVITQKSPDTIARKEAYRSAPAPAYEFLFRKLNEYAHSLRTYHGCPYACSFCVENSTWRSGSYRDLDVLFEEIKLILSSARPGTLVHFSDPIFNLDSHRTDLICHWLKENARKVYLSMDTRVDLLTHRNVSALRSAGFRYFRVGIESLVSDIISQTGKGTDLNQVSDALRALREAAPDSIVHAYWITGLPGSTVDAAEQSALDAASLVTDQLIDVLSNKVLVPYPGSDYYEHPARHGLTLLDKPWVAYDRFSPPVYELEKATGDQIYGWFCRTEALVSDALYERLKRFPNVKSPRAVETYKSIGYLGVTGQPSLNNT